MNLLCNNRFEQADRQFKILSRLAVTNEEATNQNKNKIASLMSKANSQRTKEDNETVVLHIIDKMIKQGNNDGLINKIAAVTSKTQTQKGEVAEFQALLHAHLRRFSPQEL